MKCSSIISTLFALTAISTAAPSKGDAASEAVSQANSKIQALYNVVQQRQAAIASSIANMTANSTAAQNTTVVENMRKDIQAVTTAIRDVNTSVAAVPTAGSSHPDTSEAGVDIDATGITMLQAVFDVIRQSVHLSQDVDEYPQLAALLQPVVGEFRALLGLFTTLADKELFGSLMMASALNYVATMIDIETGEIEVD